MGMTILTDIFFVTRGHQITIVKGQCRFDIRKYSLSHRTINDWNTLSADYVNVNSVNMLKSKIDLIQISEQLLDIQKANGFLVHLPV